MRLEEFFGQGEDGVELGRHQENTSELTGAEFANDGLGIELRHDFAGATKEYRAQREGHAGTVCQGRDGEESIVRAHASVFDGEYRKNQRACAMRQHDALRAARRAGGIGNAKSVPFAGEAGRFGERRCVREAMFVIVTEVDDLLDGREAGCGHRGATSLVSE